MTTSALKDSALPFTSNLNEASRLKVLHSYDVLDSEAEQAFDDLTKIAAHICQVPIALISFVDSSRLWFKSRVGLTVSEVSRDLTFCAHAISEDKLCVVPDAFADERFADSPLVTAEPNIRFYAGTPLISPEGAALGTLCVIDRVPRELNQEQEDALVALGRQVISQLVLRRRTRDLEVAKDDLELKIKERERNEKRLRLLESIATAANDAILVTEAHPLDKPGPRIVYVNDAFTRMTGYEAADVIGKTPRILQGPKTDRNQLAKLRSAITRQTAITVELINYRKDKSEFWVELNISPVSKANGECTHFVSVQREATRRKQMEDELVRAHAELEARVEARTVELSEAYKRLLAQITEREKTEAALRESEDWLRIVVNGSRDGILIEDDGKVIFVNQAYTRLLGYDSPQEIIGKPTTSILPEDDAARMSEYGRRRLRGETVPTIYAFKGLRKDGSLIDVEAAVSVSTVGDKSYIMTAIRDLAERKLAETKLREGEERYRTLVEGVKDYAIFMLDPDGNVSSWNQGAQRIKGYRADEIIGQHFSRFYTHEDLEARKPELELKAAVVEGRYEERGWRVRKDGTRFIANVVLTPLWNDAGELRGFSKVTRDVTESELANIALKESEERYRFLSEGIAHQVWTAQPEGKVDYINQRTIKYFGPEVDVLKDGWQDVVHPDDFDSCSRLWAESLQTGKSHEVECRLKRADGTYRWHSARAIAGYDADGKIYKWYGTNSDIHERKEAEEALRLSEEQLRQTQKLESIGQLAGGIAHDFNNLLAVINGYADLSLRRMTGDDPIRPKMEEIKRAGDHAASLTRQLLAFSRKQVMNPIVVDLNLVITNTSNMLKRLIGEDVEMILNLKQSLGQVKADPGQLEQVILNFAVNARDAMPQGGKLIIETDNVELSESYGEKHAAIKQGRYVRLTVSDTGVGMKPEVVERIFEPFFTTKEFGKGTGLGLSTVYGIVKQSGGYVWVYSELGVGTTFKVYLPRIDTQSAQSEVVTTQTELVKGTETILLVEDEAMVRAMTREILESGGYSVLEAGDCDEAIAASKQYEGHIDLLLTDVIMPRTGGRETAEMIRQVRPDVKVLYMSGYTNDAILRHGVLGEGTFFIEKPFLPNTLTRKIRDLLDSPKRST